MRKFETGKEYIAKTPYDSNMKERIIIEKRTAKFVTIRSEFGYTMKVKIKTDKEREVAFFVSSAIFA